jgi:hypothetical protein
MKFFFNLKYRRGIAIQIPILSYLTWCFDSIWWGEIVLDEVAVKMENTTQKFSLSLFHFTRLELHVGDVADLRQNGQDTPQGNGVKGQLLALYVN